MLFTLVWFACGTEFDTGEFDCAGAPDVTYHNFGSSFLRHNCQGCHASTTADRYGAPEGVFFDDVEQAWQWKARILAVTIGEEADMPPAGTIPHDDQMMLYWWLECNRKGT